MATPLSHTSFDSLLGRGAYLPEAAPLPQAPPLRPHAPAPAHQSPKQQGGAPARGATRPPEQQYMVISSPKKAKYSLGAGGSTQPQHASILR